MSEEQIDKALSREYEAGFVSAAHTIDDINVTLNKAAVAFASI